MSRVKKNEQLCREVERDLAEHGLPRVHVEIDNRQIAYVSGEVDALEDEATAIDIVLAYDVSAVEDGLVTPTPPSAPDLDRPQAIGPRTHRSSQKIPASPIQKILGSGHLESRVFDTSHSDSTLQTGTPLVTQSHVR